MTREPLHADAACHRGHPQFAGASNVQICSDGSTRSLSVAARLGKRPRAQKFGPSIQPPPRGVNRNQIGENG